MDIGICINMYPAPNAPGQTGVENIPLYRDAGFDYLELPGGALMHQSPGARRESEERILASGLPSPVISSLVHPSVRLTGDGVDDAVVDAYIEGVCAMGARLGVDTLVFGSAGARNVPMGFPREKAWEQLAGFLRRLGDRAGVDGQTVVIEHINRWEGNIIVSFAEGVRMVEELGHPHVRCLVDAFHLGLGNESLDLVAEKLPLVRHAHISNVLGRTIPVPGRHEVEGMLFLDFLKRHGYEGRLSVEGFTGDPGEFVLCREFFRGKV